MSSPLPVVAANRWDALDGVWPASPPSISVVILHFRQPEALARTLAALERQDHPGPLEVIVVDDGSPEPPAVPSWVRLLRQEDRGNRSGIARNLGATAASGDVLCFLDADTAPEPEYLRQLTRLPALLPDAVVVGRRRHAELAAAPHGLPVEQAGPAHALPEPQWLADGYRQTDNLLHADDRPHRYVISAVLACPRRFFAETGGFAEQLGAYGGEDWEWAYRAWLHGAALAHVPAAIAWHDGPDWGLRPMDPAQRAAQKNVETLRLARLLGIDGARGRAVRTGPAEILARLPAQITPAAAFITVDTLLAALPHAVVLAPDALLATFTGEDRVIGVSRASDPRLALPRLQLELAAAVAFTPRPLRALCDRLTAGALGAAHLRDANGPLLTAAATRHRMRVRRSGPQAGWPVTTRQVGWLQRLPAEPDVEAYLGGWQRG